MPYSCSKYLTAISLYLITVLIFGLFTCSSVQDTKELVVYQICIRAAISDNLFLPEYVARLSSGYPSVWNLKNVFAMNNDIILVYS